MANPGLIPVENLLPQYHYLRLELNNDRYNPDTFMCDHSVFGYHTKTLHSTRVNAISRCPNSVCPTILAYIHEGKWSLSHEGMFFTKITNHRDNLASLQ